MDNLEMNVVQPSPSPTKSAFPSSAIPGSGGLAAAVNAAVTAKIPKSISAFTAVDLNTYFHGLLYGETDARKTITAAEFGGVERTLILNTRSKEQMISLPRAFHTLPRIAQVEDGEGLQFALQFPEKVADAIGWPEWKDLPDRVLIVDDFSEGAEMLVDENRTNDEGKEQKNLMKVYGNTNTNFRDLLASLKRKRMHTIFVGLADVKASEIDGEESIFPKLPKGLRVILTADLEYVFFMKKETGKMLTKSSYLQYTKKDDKGKPVMARREIFAKHKLPKELVGRTPPVVLAEEPMDLKALWQKIRTAK